MTGRRGFTLLEILLAISIVAILLLTVYGVFATAESSRRRIASRAGGYHLARVIFDRIERELLSLPTREPAESSLLAGGRDDRGRPYLALLTLAGEGRDGGLRKVRYRLEKEEAGSRRLTRLSTIWPEPLQEPPAGRLSDRISLFRPRFHDGTTWRDDWDSRRDGLPRLIELTLGIETPEETLRLHTAIRLPTEERF
ncbi:type II secretion system protein J (GspJ) [Geothermobacter ehrlichii]|uniref:Type II secretion system protein J n=1 Tax=Geothermobacter ehrlichii TaxID=213224 RepID=A0A5D3WHL7_9BACT|nr:type II secretion system protein GspJ [Geothermobacter ehrlichii]TYO97559.1 type II secretion system protein J (GspJ) [Geothermobacter ehrlichii]